MVQFFQVLHMHLKSETQLDFELLVIPLYFFIFIKKLSYYYDIFLHLY